MLGFQTSQQRLHVEHVEILSTTKRTCALCPAMKRAESARGQLDTQKSASQCPISSPPEAVSALGRPSLTSGYGKRSPRARRLISASCPMTHINRQLTNSCRCRNHQLITKILLVSPFKNIKFPFKLLQSRIRHDQMNDGELQQLCPHRSIVNEYP